MESEIWLDIARTKFNFKRSGGMQGVLIGRIGWVMLEWAGPGKSRPLVISPAVQVKFQAWRRVADVPAASHTALDAIDASVSRSQLHMENLVLLFYHSTHA